MASVTPPMEAAICDMPLIPWKPEFHTKYSPSVLVFTLAIGWYYLNGIWSPTSTVSGLGWLLPFFFILILAVVQTFVIGKQKACPPTMTFGLIAAWVIGIASGTIGYWVAYWAMLPGPAAPKPMILGPGGEYNPNAGGGVTPAVGAIQERFGLLDVNSGVAFKQQKKSGDAGGGGGVTMDLTKPSNPTTCRVPDDDTYYVDLYKNGQLITESIGEKLIS
jgi:hypothetical protein